MKLLIKRCLLGLLSIISSASGAQVSEVLQLSYEYINHGSGTRQLVTLSVKGAEGFSEFGLSESSGTSDTESKDFSISGEDSVGRQVYRNLSTRELVFRDFAPSDGEFKAYIVNDPWTEMNWAFTPEVKRIGKYECRKATTRFRGRNYEAWYTDQIPLRHGPWKFAGLPGAIVEVRSTDNIIQFNLTRIDKMGSGSIRKPNMGNTLTMKEYAFLREESINDFIRVLKAKLPRGAEVSVEATGDNNLETDFSDVKK